MTARELELASSDQPLYEGQSIPFERLDPGRFEQCVFACFQCIQADQNLRIDAQPSGSGDGGFDVEGVAANTGRRACIQCKRQKARLGLPLLAKEVAKVAATAALGRSDVGVHFFICTGGVTKDLRRFLRESDRATILRAAVEALVGANEGELKSLREQLICKDKAPDDVVRSYVGGLDRLLAWDLEELDSALSTRWSDVLEVLGRYFRVASVVREHPRAQFARDVYQDRCAEFVASVQPRLEKGELPAGLAASSAADPGPKSAAPMRPVLDVPALASLAPGETALVVAEGGAGKTTLLRLIRAEVARTSGESALSVLVSCADYTSGGLDQAVHAQLGVQSGSWRTLPDRIVLLCDGINEAPPELVKALFSELSPLLGSRQVSCIFTSREDSRSARMVLPAIPCASLRLVPLTPGRVRRLAREILVDKSNISAFADAYGAMANRAAGSFIWTPFAVRVALKLWVESRVLGDTLGELLQAVLTARADRDLEIASAEVGADLPKDSVLGLAAAMAFQLLVVEHQVSCRVSEVGGVLARAKAHCANTLGADGLNSVQFAALLLKHDLIQRTADDSFRWSHQLVAGALAAPLLAREWKRYVATLQRPLTDDAWIFAAKFIQESELDEFLQTLFDADLMLGAKAAAELPRAERDRALKYIARALQPGEPENLQVTGLFALARLQTERALGVLRGLEESRESDLGFAAARALAYSGDKEFLLRLGEEIDRCRQMGWSMSGGDVAIWEEASFADRISIARERLSVVKPGEPANESLSLVAYEATIDDLPLLEPHFMAAKTLIAWRTSLRAIERADRLRAQELFEQTLFEATTNAERGTIITAAHELGLAVDSDSAFTVLLALAEESDGDTNTALARSDLVTKVLSRVPLTESITTTVEKELPTSTGELKQCLWHLAPHIPSGRIATLALETFEKDANNVGMAANFFLANSELRTTHFDSLVNACEAFLSNKIHWFTFGAWRVLELMAELGFTPAAADSLRQMILRLSQLLETAEAGEVPEFEATESHLARGFEVDNARIRLERYAGPLVPGVVGAIQHLMPEVVLKLLRFDLARSSPGKEFVEALRHIDPELIDETLASVGDPWAQRSGLEIVCEFGLTERRLDLLRTHLRETYCHPAGIGDVTRTLEKCWNTKACEMVVETVAGFEEWPLQWQQCFWDFARMVSDRLLPSDRPFVERHLATAKTEFARRILGIWRQVTFDSRVGLSRLEMGQA